MKKIFLLLIFLAFIPLAVMGYINKDNVNVKFTLVIPEPPAIEPETTYFSVPGFEYDQLLGEEIGFDNWQEAKKLFKKEGFSKFSEGDIFAVTKKNGNVFAYILHHYTDKDTGIKIAFVKKNNSFEKIEEPLTINVNSIVKNFQIKTKFSEDFPEFYESAKKYMTWDWFLLELLAPGDSISFIIKGVFDKDILVQELGIDGFSVKSRELGSFTLTAYRDKYYGDFFVSDKSAIFSPEGFFRVPIDYGRITSPFGIRNDPFSKKIKMHKGIDIAAKHLTPVHAARDGFVIFAGWKRLLGRTVIIDHGFGIKTLYGHLGSISIKSGAIVKKGDIIGGAGSSGRSTSTHLHFTVYMNDEPVEPMKFSYERLWISPFEISSEIAEKSDSKASALLESIQNESTFFLN